MSATNEGKFNKVKAENVIVGTQHIVNHYYGAEGDEKARERLKAQIDSYLKWVVERYGTIVLRGIERAGGAPVVVLDLDTVYVPLEATLSAQPGDGDLRARMGKALRHLRGNGEPEALGQADALEINLKDVAGLGNRLVIVGGPGSGKTTVLLHMAWALAASLLDASNKSAETRLGLTGELPLPIFVPLSAFNHHRRTLPAGAPAEEQSLSHFISRHLIASDAGIALPRDFFSRLIEQGQHVLLLLDGLDEVANEDERADVTQAVQSLVAGKNGLRAVVTCRTAAYASPGTPLGAGFRHIQVKPLDFKVHVTPLIRQAHRCIYPRDPGEAKRRSDRLLSEIERLEDARRARGGATERLVNSPLMVRLLLIVDYNERELPDERAKLFEKAVEALIRADYHPIVTQGQTQTGNWETRRDMLQQLAFHMHNQGEEQGREIEEATLKRVLKAETEFAPHIKDLIEHARNRGGLLEERDGNYRFIHLAFQEFLAARYLREVMGGEGLDAIVQFLSSGKLTDPWWREPILLLAGYMAAHAARNAREFLRKLSLTGKAPDDQLAAAELAGVGTVEWKDSGENSRAELAARIVALYDDLPGMSAAQPALRARAGRALARLGDPRDHVRKVDAMRLCLIPAGPFHMGSPREDTRAWDDERPSTPDFLIDYTYAIGEHPITQAQFVEFAQTGYEEKQWWTAAIAAGCWEDGHVIRRLLYANDPAKAKRLGKYRLETERADGPYEYGEPYSLPNHPIVGVSWYEALAFCAWLEARWRQVGWLRGDQRVRLPSEPEWEKAGRGGDRVPKGDPLLFAPTAWPSSDMVQTRYTAAHPEARRYPYGDAPDAAKANFDETKLESTSPIGCFPNGASPYGCQDMSGNVWEWTRSAWGPWRFKEGDYDIDLQYPYPYSAEDGREAGEGDLQMARVLRGGSFFYNAWFARCAYRSRNQPDNRYSDVGFRVVVSPSFSSL